LRWYEGYNCASARERAEAILTDNPKLRTTESGVLKILGFLN